MKVYNKLAIVVLAFLFATCKPEIDTLEPSAGNADFSKYIAVGNSLTSGYRDGDLFRSGQLYSYPNIIAQQLKLVGGGEFTQPLMYDELGFGNKMVLNLNTVKDCAGNPVPGVAPSLGPIPYRILDNSPSDPRNFVNMEELQNSTNLGVPGAKSFHLLIPYYGSVNPYFNRFSALPEITILQQAVSHNATFFTLWIGNNDVLTYALNGAEADSITSIPIFTWALSNIINGLTENGAKGAVANLPDITSIAYFTTFPYNALALTDQAQIDALNTAYQPFNITFSLGANPLIVQDANAPGGRRQIKSTELVLLSLSQDSIRCAGWGSLKPIPPQFFLDEQEIAEIKTATEQYNEIIENLAEAKGLALVDANAFLETAKSGLVFDGVRYSAKYISGGINSLDGIHLSPRGNAMVANYFIEAINKKYAANIPTVDINDYPGIPFP